MARRYDSRTTIFSPEGRLYQVEYALEAISHAGQALGILAKDGVFLATEKKVLSKLLEPTRAEKIIKIDDHVVGAVAGIVADANSLVNYARGAAQRHFFKYQEPILIEQLVQQVADLKQQYTQFGGLRPFGASFLYAGWDRELGFQMYQSDPSGNYNGWQATAVGSNSSAATSILRQEYKEGLSLEDAHALAIRVLSKTIDASSLTSEKLEFAQLTRDEKGHVKIEILEENDVDELLKKHLPEEMQS